MHAPLTVSARTLLLILLAVVLATGALVSGRPAASAEADPVRIMPLGDSITGSPGCWRALLWNDLLAAGHTDIDFVGTLAPQGCGVAHDGDNEGHGGYLATTIAATDLLPGWLAATDPHVVLMHLGTNDVWSNRSTTEILAAFTTLVAQMRAHNPQMTVLVAQIVPVDPPTCAECADRTTALNAALPAWAAGLTSAASPVTVVDQWTGWDADVDTSDGVHPNASGTAKMAAGWFAPLTAALEDRSGTAPTPTPTPTPIPTPTPLPGMCTATSSVVGAWPGGFQGQVVVTNTGTSALTGWTARWTVPAGEQVVQSWGGHAVQDGREVVVSAAGWNAVLAPGGSATVGFIGSTTSAGQAPEVTCE